MFYVSTSANTCLYHAAVDFVKSYEVVFAMGHAGTQSQVGNIHFTDCCVNGAKHVYISW